MADQKISQLTSYTPALDADVLPIVDTANTATKKITWANVKATLKTYFDTLYGNMTNPMTTGGDVIYGGASGAPTRLANGSAGQVLTSAGTTLAPTWTTIAGSGDVSKVGTPVNNQVGVWTGDGTIEGDTALTFDTGTDVLSSGGFLGTALTASEMLITDGSKNIVSAAVATYPSLTELAYVKGATSSIQTQLTARLPLSGGTMSGNIVLGENTSLQLDPAGSADGKYSGITVTGVAGYAQTYGDLVYLAAADSRWELADADAATTGDRMLAMVVVAGGSDGAACTLLLQGIIRADAKFPALTIGSAVYVGETAGEIQVAIPTGADSVIRRVGYAMTADEIYFNPSMDSQISVA